MQGRGAEHLLARILVKPGLRVPSNLYFTTSREHVVLAGGIWEDIAVPEARQPESMFPFKVCKSARACMCYSSSSDWSVQRLATPLPIPL